MDDIQIFRQRSNSLRDGENIIDTASTHFLPTLEIDDYYNDPIVKTVLRPNGIDMQELLTYIEPNIVTRWRNINNTSQFDNAYRKIYPMKVCQISDFETRGL